MALFLRSTVTGPAAAARPCALRGAAAEFGAGGPGARSRYLQRWGPGVRYRPPAPAATVCPSVVARAAVVSLQRYLVLRCCSRLEQHKIRSLAYDMFCVGGVFYAR